MKYYFNEDAKSWPLWKEPIVVGGEGGRVEGGEEDNNMMMMMMKPAPVTKETQDELVDRLQDAKTEYYKILLEEVATPRPGIIELMDEAIKDPRIKVMID